MLSYRHAYHAGNQGDVLKHWVLVLCLEYLKRKDKPFFYMDTHAGAGQYSLMDAYARKTAESDSGIARIWNDAKAPAVLSDYLTLVASFNKVKPPKLHSYPGSPVVAAALMRSDDRLRLIEMHSSDRAKLEQHFCRDRRVKVMDGDGFQLLKGLLPPVTRRGIVLVDPSYEMKTDYQRVPGCLKESLNRFASGTYLVWYPLINSLPAQRYSDQLKKLPCDNWLDVQLRVNSPPQGHGMYGSGMFVINPPWTLKADLEQGLPYLTEKLGDDETAEWAIQHNQ
ncbi:MAG: 23S rRNA (adenine(2030)-N(6))-methyltransferase RlmJ [Ketobacter sp.]